MTTGNSPVIRPAAAASKPPPRRRRWPIIIAALLVAHTALMITFVAIATRDPNFSVDPDYYGKAIRWDQQQARQRASDLLGWQADLMIEGPQRQPILTLTDGMGRPIPSISASATYFHYAHAQDVRTTVFNVNYAQPTRFMADVLLPYAGEWEFHVTASTPGGQEFLKRFVVEAH